MGWRLTTTGDVRFDVPEEVSESDGPGIYPTRDDAVRARIARLTDAKIEVQEAMQDTITELQGYIDEAEREIG